MEEQPEEWQAATPVAPVRFIREQLTTMATTQTAVTVVAAPAATLALPAQVAADTTAAVRAVKAIAVAAAILVAAGEVGLDLSADMLAQAQRKLTKRPMPVTLRQQRYDRPLSPEPAFDLIIFSYCLSMINPGWRQALDSALRDLRPGGRLAVVDFHDTRFPVFQRWMAVNHVRMNGHLLPNLNAHCAPLHQTPCTAYGGLWRYFRFIGQKRDE